MRSCNISCAPVQQIMRAKCIIYVWEALNDPNDHGLRDTEFMSQRNNGKPKESRRGRPTTGRDPVVAVRLPHEAIADVDRLGPVAGLVGIEGGVVSGVMNLESLGVEAPGRRPRHDQR